MLIAGIALALVVILVVTICIVSASSRNKKYESLVQDAQRSLLAEEYDYALQYAQQALEVKKISNTKKETVYLLMADIYVAKGDPAAAKNVIYNAYMELGTKALEDRLLELNELVGDGGGTLQIGSVTLKTGAVSAVLSNMGLKSADIAQLSTLTKLQTLTLSQNELDDISVLAELKELTYLQLAENNITDISPLKELTALKSLYLDANPIEDFSPLYALTNLTVLSLNNIDLSDEELSTLKSKLPDCDILNDKDAPTELKLGGQTISVEAETVDLSGAGITDIADFVYLTKLTSLDLSGNSVHDIEPLEGLILLEHLSLKGNGISTISALSALVNVTYLDLRDNSVKDLTPVSNMDGLKELYLDNNSPMTLSPLTYLTELTTLSLKNCDLKDADLEYLKGLTNLRSLTLDGCDQITGTALMSLQQALPDCSISAPDVVMSVKWNGTEYGVDSTSITARDCGITDISMLKSFDKLEFLDLGDNHIADASALSELKTLKELDLSGNELTTARDLQNLTNLTVLDISDNADITLTGYLSGLTKLEYLDISDNEGITDVSPLYNLTNLRQLDVSGTGISWDQLVELCEHLSSCQVYTDLTEPTPSPTPEPTAAPTPEPTAEPTPAPTPVPEITDDT